MATSTQLLRTVNEFDDENEDWSSYIEQMEFYFMANKIESDDIKKAVLLSCCGISTYRVFKGLTAPLKSERPNCSCCDRCLYNQNIHGNKPWQPLQGTANRLTHLYRDGNEGLKAGIELGYHAGYQKRNKDIVNWARKKKRHIKREDLLLNLCGRSPPRRKFNDARLSPRPNFPATTELPFNGEFDFNAFMEGRNPFTEGRKRHNDITMSSLDQSPHKRGKFS